MLSTTSLLCPKNERQQSVNHFRPSILEIQGATRPQWCAIVQLAAFLGKYGYDKIGTMFQNDLQRSVNNLCAGIVDNLTWIEHRYTIMVQSTAIIWKNVSDDITSASSNSAPTLRQGSKRYRAIKCIMPFRNGVWRGQSLQSVLVFNFRNMHAMFHWSGYFPWSCSVNI